MTAGPELDERSEPAAEPAPTTSASGRRLSVVTLDQILSSISNVGALIWVAHTLEPIDFGRFSLIMMIYMVALVGIRSLISTTVLVHPDDADQRSGSVLGAALLIATACGLACGALGALLVAGGNSLGWPVLALALPLPSLLLQDVGRYLAIGRQQPGRAVVLDGLWITLTGCLFGLLLVLDLSSLAWLVLAWAGAGGLAGLFVLVLFALPARDGMAWVRHHWSFSWRATVSGVSASGITLGMAALMSLFSSAAAVAAFRAATLLSAPSTAVQMAVSTSAAADIAREPDDRILWRHVRNAILVCTVIGLVNLAVLVFLPDVVGTALLGDAWWLVAPLLLPVGLKVLLMAAQGGLRAALLGRRRIQVVMVTDIANIALIGVCMVGGAILGDVEGALWAMAVGTAVSTLCWWIAMAWLRGSPLRGQGRHRA